MQRLTDLETSKQDCKAKFDILVKKINDKEDKNSIDSAAKQVELSKDFMVNN
jgi:hypothetical protein